MTAQMRPQRAVRLAAVVCALAAVTATLTLGGCQSYEPAPLDIAGHRAAIGSRLGEAEPVRAFAERLRASGLDAPAAFDPADGLSLPEGEVLALFYNPDLRLARLGAGVALATYETAGLWEDPVFGFDGAEILSPAGVFEYGLTLSLTIPVSGRLAVERARAGAAHEAALRRLVDAEWSTRAEVRRAWAEWSIAVARRDLLREGIEQIERISRITEDLEAAGELSRVEARLFRVELSARRASLSEAEASAEAARLALLGLMGLPMDADVALLPTVALEGSDPGEDPVERLIRHSTVLAVERAEYRAAEEALRLEIREQYPDITIGGGYGSEDGGDRLLLGVSIPVPVLNANRAGIADARAQREVARAEAEIAFERLARRLAVAQSTHEAARRQLAAFEAEIVPMLAEQVSDVERIASLGEVDTLLLLDTVTRQLRAKARLLELKETEVDAMITIAELLGPDEPAGPPAPVEPREPEGDLAGEPR